MGVRPLGVLSKVWEDVEVRKKVSGLGKQEQREGNKGTKSVRHITHPRLQ